MKKIIISAIFMLTAFLLNAQISCPTNVKRNNGNNCLSGGTGGRIELEFATAPDSKLQILLITSGMGEATVIGTSKQSEEKSGKWYLSWCFESDNLGPVTNGNLSYTFYIDTNGNGQLDDDENIFVCSQIVLPIKFKSITTRRLDTNTIRVIFEAEEDNTIKHYNIRVSFDGRVWKTHTIVFPDGVQGSKRYQVDLKNITNKN